MPCGCQLMARVVGWTRLSSVREKEYTHGTASHRAKETTLGRACTILTPLLDEHSVCALPSCKASLHETSTRSMGPHLRSVHLFLPYDGPVRGQGSYTFHSCRFLLNRFSLLDHAPGLFFVELQVQPLSPRTHSACSFYYSLCSCSLLLPSSPFFFPHSFIPYSPLTSSPWSPSESGRRGEPAFVNSALESSG